MVQAFAEGRPGRGARGARAVLPALPGFDPRDQSHPDQDRRSASRAASPGSSACRFARWLRPMPRSCWPRCAISTSSNNLGCERHGAAAPPGQWREGPHGAGDHRLRKAGPGGRGGGEVDAGMISPRRSGADAVIEFSHHTVTARGAGLRGGGQAAGHRHHGPYRWEVEQIRAASASIPLVFAPNFSVGVNALFWLTQKAAEILGPDFDLEVVEMHHRLKKDAPSGTARRLAEILAACAACNTPGTCGMGAKGSPASGRPRDRDARAARRRRGGGPYGDFRDPGGAGRADPQGLQPGYFCPRGHPRGEMGARARPGLYDMQDVLGLR
jgi:4-hydroxy-tetrahydrodipicolinate reductase